MKSTDLTSQATLAAAAVIGGPRTRRGWGGNTCCNINTDACFDTCVSQGSSRMVSSRPVLERVIRRADTAQRSHTLRRYMATDAACCVALPGAQPERVQGAMVPNHRLSGFFTEKNWLCRDVGPALFNTVKFCGRRLKKFLNFFEKKCFGAQLLQPPT